jgi:hypothetical protein
MATLPAVIHALAAPVLRYRFAPLSPPVAVKAPPHDDYVLIVIGIDMRVDQVESVGTLVLESYGRTSWLGLRSAIRSSRS